MFSILIPSWNNLEYLKLCVSSIRKNSAYPHEILVHVNDGSDGTLAWVQSEGIRYSHSNQNTGICLTVNHLAGLATQPWLVYMNDDMVCCPGWDLAYMDAIRQQTTDLIFLSSTLIEPIDTQNPVVIVQDFGTTPENFDEKGLFGNYLNTPRQDLSGRGSQPTLVSKRWWHMVGGYSLEFSPGMSSDDDLLMKFWVAGCRTFKVLGKSRVYHFSCRSTGRVRKNKGARTFVTKWGITQGEFKKHYLENSQAQHEPGSHFPHATRLGRFKRAIYGLTGDFPLGDIRAWDAAPGLHFSGEQHVVPANSAQSDPDAP
jgi:GT2 family glycosyltransferase|nr:glycosyltransferase [Thiomonas sp.]